MNDPLIIPIALATIGILVSAIASGAETGLYVLNRVRLAVRASKLEPRAVRLQAELAQPERTLSVLLIINNIANYAGAFGVAAILSGVGFDSIGVIVLNTLIVVPLLFVLGETLPKDMFRIHADRWLFALATPLRATRWALTVCGLVPLVLLVGRLAASAFGSPSGIDSEPRSRIASLLQESVGVGGLSSDQASLVHRALEMDDRAVAQEMTPWRSVVAIHAKDAQTGLSQAARRTERSRLPILDDEGKVLGVVNVLDTLLAPTASIEDLLQPVVVLPASTRVLDALNQLRLERKPLAIIIDETPQAKPIGLVTLKDLVEPLIGDLRAW